MSPHPKTILILSTGRTGTMFLARLLAESFPQAEVHHEAGGSRQINLLANLYSAHLLPKSALISWWRLKIGSSLAHCQKDFYIDSNNYLYGLVPSEPKLYPNLHVIHLVRDPRTYVASHLTWMKTNRRSKIANYLVPFWQPNPFLIGEMGFFQWITLSRFAKYCWVWSYKNRILEATQAAAIPYLCVRFEDLFDPEYPLNTLRQMIEFVGLPELHSLVAERFQQPVNASHKSNSATWLDWTSKQCSVLDHFCRQQMQHYAYGREPEWLAKLPSSNSHMATL